MDSHVSVWILEFLLRQPLPDRLLSAVLSALPSSSSSSPHLLKTLLLRKLQLSPISETLLDHLETLEQLYHLEHIPAPAPMRSAYCSVAVACTVGDGKGEEAVRRVWRERVCRVEGLWSEELEGRMVEIEAAVGDEGKWEEMRKGMEEARAEAVEKVRVFVEGEWTAMGPSFLELVARKAGEAVEEIYRGGGVVGPAARRDHGVRRKHIEMRRKCGKGAKISDVDKGNGDERVDKVNNTQAPQVDTLRAPIETSPMEEELQATKEVDRPNVPQTAETLASKEVDRPNVPQTAEALASKEVDRPNLPQTVGTLATPEDNVNTNTPKFPLKRRKRVAVRRKHGKGAKISDIDEGDEDNPTTAKTDNTSLAPEVPQTDNIKAKAIVAEMLKLPKPHETPEVERVHELLKSSYIDLRASVRDPLPDALEIAEALRSTTMATNNNRSDEPPVVNWTGLRASPRVRSRTNNDQAIPRKELIGLRASPRSRAGNNQETAQKEQDHGMKLRKRGLMDPDGNAQTLEWTDSFDEPPEGSRKRRLPGALKEPKPSPLKMEGKRERRKWTPDEEEALRTGVGKFGKGHWKLILLSYREILWGRSEVDLKDKWRNLTKSNKVG